MEIKIRNLFSNRWKQKNQEEKITKNKERKKGKERKRKEHEVRTGGGKCTESSRIGRDL